MSTTLTNPVAEAPASGAVAVLDDVDWSPVEQWLRDAAAALDPDDALPAGVDFIAAAFPPFTYTPSSETGTDHGGAEKTVADITAQVEALAHALRTTALDGESAAVLLERLAAVEVLQRTAAWYAGEAAVAFDAARRAEDEAAGVPRGRVGSSVAGEMGLARRVSPNRAARDLGLAKVARAELPATWMSLRDGQIPAVTAVKVASATAMLAREDRLAVDERLAADDLGSLSVAAADALAHTRAYEADPRVFVAARARAEEDRYVSSRPVPDVMMQLSALLPMTQGVAVIAALTKAADAARAAGDPRSKNQVMADTLVTRVTGQTSADAVPLRVNLVLDPSTLLASDGGTAAGALHATGQTPQPLPGAVALDLIGSALGRPASVELRRLFTAPDAADLVAMESSSRLFPDDLREFVVLRDGICRTPWCGAPIRHLDHVEPHADGGLTSAANAAGRCERCNHTKQHPGWRESLDPSGRLTIITPTGHTT